MKMIYRSSVIHVECMQTEHAREVLSPVGALDPFRN